ncbi:MAG: SDR family NAD(P)-dependent oxidoreductase [Dehalococcoidales bacterium]|nr:SDR family NAD(P)-dependent oxidoreductase [Dehalococcoidales bacterium]
MKLKGKVAIVTGASRGLGKAIALGFAREGASVVIAARSEVENDKFGGSIYKTAEEIKALGQAALPLKCDVTDETSVNEMVEKTKKEFGGIDILVNNAGVTFYAPVIETPLKRWELVLKVNIIGAFLCCRAVIPLMVKRGRGSIINISSLAANDRHESVTIPTGVAYGVSKAGLERFTFGLASELGKDNIAVNAIKPVRVVSTEGTRYWMAEADKSEWQSPDKMVSCAVFLAQQDAHGVTGAVASDDELFAWHGLKI